MSTLTETTFKRIADIARRRWGLSLGERKMQLVANRLTSHLRKAGGGEIEDYVLRLERNPTEEDMLVLFDILSSATQRTSPSLSANSTLDLQRALLRYQASDSASGPQHVPSVLSPTRLQCRCLNCSLHRLVMT